MRIFLFLLALLVVTLFMGVPLHALVHWTVSNHGADSALIGLAVLGLIAFGFCIKTDPRR